MSNGSYFEMNPEGIAELLQSPEMEAALLEIGAGFEGERRIWHSHDRASLQIYRDTNDGNAMLKELFGGANEH